MRKIVECVPNFSEGKDKKIIQAITSPIENIEGVKLLSVEPDADYNRTVVTFAGEPEAVLQAAVESASKGLELIDMRKHKGEHPRMGAVDVVPFIPVSGITNEECIELSERFAQIISEKYSYPVYLYEDSARKEERKNLAQVRKGEYEALEEKLKLEEWKPDYGPANFVPKYGATATGCRFFLIAYNVNLRTKDKDIANKIAKTLRESGYKKTLDNGEKVRVPGRLKAVKGMGFYLDNYGVSQVSMNLINFRITPPHIAFEEVKKEADKYDIEVSGSELVGLIPEEAILMAGKYYAPNDSLTNEQLVELAAEKMNLSDLYPVDIKKRIIEYLV